MGDAAQQQGFDTCQPPRTEDDRPCAHLVGLREDRFRDRRMSGPRARLRVQACSRRTLDAFGRALAGAFLIGLVDLFIVGDPWRETQAGARPCHHVYERLPHCEDRRRLAAEQLAGLVDCGLRVGGSILGDQDHVVHFRSSQVCTASY